MFSVFFIRELILKRVNQWQNLITGETQIFKKCEIICLQTLSRFVIALLFFYSFLLFSFSFAPKLLLTKNYAETRFIFLQVFSHRTVECCCKYEIMLNKLNLRQNNDCLSCFCLFIFYSGTMSLCKVLFIYLRCTMTIIVFCCSETFTV